MTSTLPLSFFVTLYGALLASVWLSLCVHESGHLVCALLVTSQSVTLQIGRGRVRRRWCWGRLRVIVCADRLVAVFLPIAAVAVPPQGLRSRRVRLALYASGPVASALLSITAGAVMILGHFPRLWLLALWVLVAVSACDAVINCIPFRPRRRFVAREGAASDGLQMLRLLRPARLAHTFPVREGVVSRPGYDLWHRTVGDGDLEDTSPLVLVPGGPGLPHDYLEPLELLAGAKRRVILYDQAGCGRSGTLSDPAQYSLAFFVEELDALRLALGLERFHLWGTGWGASVALEYALAHPEALRSLVINGTGPSMADNVADLHELLADPDPDDDLLPSLSSRTRRLLREHRDACENTDPDYQAAALEFMQRHFCRLDPWPPCLLATLRGLGRELCQAMFGPNSFYPSGPLLAWDIGERLGQLDLPVLVTGGAHDDVAPGSVEAVAAAIPGALWCLFPRSSATPFLEEAERYRVVVGDFLAQVETRPFASDGGDAQDAQVDTRTGAPDMGDHPLIARTRRDRAGADVILGVAQRIASM